MRFSIAFLPGVPVALTFSTRVLKQTSRALHRRQVYVPLARSSV